METAKKPRVQYRCKKCQKTDKKGRLVGHFFKYHVTFDQVPYTCSLCSFRCQTQQHLLDHVTKYAPHVKEAKMRGVTDLRRYLNKSDNPYIVSELDIERLGDPVSEPHADEAEKGWFDVPKENPILPDWLTPTQAPKLQSPVIAAPTGLNMFRHQPYVPNHLPLPLQDISNGWFIQNHISNEVPVYRHTPKAAGQAQLFQPAKTPNSTAGAKFVKSVVTPGTPIQDEIVLQLDDTSSLDFLDEEPLELLAQKVCSGSTTAKGVDPDVQPTPAKKVRQSASPTRFLPKVPEERVKTAVPTSLILGNIQKLTSNMAAGVERIVTEMSRHTRLLERQNDLLHRVTTAVLQVRDDMDRLRRRENRSSVKSVSKNIRK
ncbi:hypothetical protein DPMN_137095 [Dreissena polymorpha]|uniref:Uncharacterized protein n=1 Tax=Dreissena polymorpha TaxID=45954 RepID=A0A9D4G256_DREPO|nr:hypothetical protein DPMN_137095 [Dreissena polymorpha]